MTRWSPPHPRHQILHETPLLAIRHSYFVFRLFITKVTIARDTSPLAHHSTKSRPERGIGDWLDQISSTIPTLSLLASNLQAILSIISLAEARLANTPFKMNAPIQSPNGQQVPASHAASSIASATSSTHQSPTNDAAPQQQLAGAHSAPSTDAFLRDFTLVAEAAKRAQMAVMMRDFESVGLS